MKGRQEIILISEYDDVHAITDKDEGTSFSHVLEVDSSVSSPERMSDDNFCEGQNVRRKTGNVRDDQRNKIITCDANGSIAAWQKPDIFKVIGIVSDKQDLSFVEKIQVPEDQIFFLCNKLVPDGAAITGQHSEIKINFTALNERCLPVVGFYGDKRMMVEIFQNKGLIKDVVLVHLQDGKFEPGLYVQVLEKVLLIFYWHEGEHLKDASRKDVSCNFIRYMVELCDSIHVCVGGEPQFGALAAVARTAALKRKRTKRLQINHLKNTEDGCSLSNGFSVHTNRDIQILPPTTVSTVSDNYIFSEGFYRCVLLTRDYGFSKLSTREDLTINSDKLKSYLQNWTKANDVDFNRLSNKDFLCLLKIVQPTEYYDYCKWKENRSVQMQENRKKTSFSELEGSQERVISCFLKILTKFCPSIVYLWDSMCKRGGGKSCPNTESCPSGCSTSSNEQESYCDMVRLDQLHQEVCLAFSETGKNLKPLFVGSEITFSANKSIFNFTIGRPEKPIGPIIYGEKVVLMFSAPISTEDKGIFFQENKKEGLILSGDRLLLRLSSDGKEISGTVEVMDCKSSNIETWLGSLIPARLVDLERNISFLSLVLNNGEVCHLSKLNNSMINDLLIGHDLRSLERNLPKEMQSLCMRFRHQPHTIVKHSCNVFLSHHFGSNLFCSLYEKGLQEFERKVAGVFKKELCFLAEKMSRFRSKRFDVKTQFKEEEDAFVSKIKQGISVNTGKRVVWYIEEVHTFEKRYRLRKSIQNIKLVFSKEREQSSIVWNISEIAPMKKDLDGLSLNSAHQIKPRCGDSFKLVTINPHIQKLQKVVALRSGELLIFIRNFQDSSLYVYNCPCIGSNLFNKKPIHTFRRGFDLLAIDELTRFVALYDRTVSRIKLYRFDEAFRNIDWTGVEVGLEEYSGSRSIVWIHLIPGKKEILLADDTNRVRAVELHLKPMMKPRHISLSCPITKACISNDGYFLIVFRVCSETRDHGIVKCNLVTRNMNESSHVMLEMYVLADSMSYLKSICPSVSIRTLDDLQGKIVNFGSVQSHLVFRHIAEPDLVFSNVLNTTSAKEIVQLQEIGKRACMSYEETGIPRSCATLEYIYHIFDKFATHPLLSNDFKKDVLFNILVQVTDSTGSCIQNECMQYLMTLLQRLNVDKGKDFSSFRVQVKVGKFVEWVSRRTESGLLELRTEVPMGLSNGTMDTKTSLPCACSNSSCREQWNDSS